MKKMTCCLILSAFILVSCGEENIVYTELSKDQLNTVLNKSTSISNCLKEEENVEINISLVKHVEGRTYSNFTTASLYSLSDKTQSDFNSSMDITLESYETQTVKFSLVSFKEEDTSYFYLDFGRGVFIKDLREYLPISYLVGGDGEALGLPNLGLDYDLLIGALSTSISEFYSNKEVSITYAKTKEGNLYKVEGENGFYYYFETKEDNGSTYISSFEFKILSEEGDENIELMFKGSYSITNKKITIPEDYSSYTKS